MPLTSFDAKIQGDDHVSSTIDQSSRYGLPIPMAAVHPAGERGSSS
jgi:hypothetical protein